MTARDAILDAIRRNLPRPEVALPNDPGVGRREITSSLGFGEARHIGFDDPGGDGVDPDAAFAQGCSEMLHQGVYCTFGGGVGG